MSIAKYLAKLAQGVDSQGQLSVSKIAGGVDTTPTITAIAYPGDDTATDPAGGQTITLTGTNFANGAKVIVNGVTAGVVTVVSSNQITFVAPANPAGSYILYLVNTNGSTAIAAPGIQYSQLPIFSVAAGSLGTLYETTSVNTATTAASNSTITYSIQSGTLPTGVTLNTSTGTITGTSPLTAASTTYTFTVRATDGELQDGVRQFSLTINPDVVNFTNPISSGTLTAYQGVSAIIPIQSTTGSGSSVVYSASGVPSGMTLSGSNFSGTPTTLGSSTGTLTGTTVASNRTSQITFTWTISVLGDLYWPQTTVLLTGTVASGIDTFVADGSLNNNQLTVVGDTRPSRQNPYQAGYYSNYFDGTGDYLSIAHNASLSWTGTVDGSIEAWVYMTSFAGSPNIIGKSDISGTSYANYSLAFNTSGNILGFVGNSGSPGSALATVTSATTIPLGTWTHVAFTRRYVGGGAQNEYRIFINGVLQGSTTAANPTDARAGVCLIGATSSGTVSPLNGYISNLRFSSSTIPAAYQTTSTTNGTLVFTPSTTPLTEVSGTSLLTCQSNRLVDNSTNAFAITKAGDVSVQQFSPFAIPANTYGSAYFDGTGDYLNSITATNAGYKFGTSNFTVEYWIHPTAFATYKSLWGCSTAATNATGFHTGLNATGNVFIYSASAFKLTTSNTLVLNAWNHVAIVRNGTAVTIYINGVSGGTWTLTTESFTDGAFFFGAAPGGASEYYTGYATNIRIVNGTALYTATFTPPTASLTAVTNTQLLTCQTSQATNNSQFVDNGPGAYLATRSGNVTQGSLNPYGSGHSIYVNTGGSQGWLQPSGVYAKTGGTSSGYVNLTGAFTFECWVYMTAGGRNAIFGESGGGAYSYAPGIGIFDTANAVSTGLNPGLVFLTSPISGYGGNFAYGSGLGFPTLNTWTHLAMCRDSSNNWHFYMNGVKGTTANANSLVSGNVAMPANNGPAGSVSLSLTMFNWDGFITGGNSTSMSAGFNGYLSDVRLVEGTALYTGASLTVPTQPLTSIPGTIVLIGQDNKYTNFANDKGITFTPISVVGNKLRTDKFSKFNTSAGSKIPTSYSNYFDGTGDYFSTPVSTNTPGWNIMAPSGSGGGTVEAWINRTNNTAGSSIPERIICGCLNIGAAYTGWYLAVSSTGQLSIKGYITGNNAGPAINSGVGLVALNTWTHIAVSCVSGAVTFYINGVSYSGGTMPATWLINNTATATIVGDAYPTWNSPFIGYISNLRMINNTALYTGAALTVPATPLTTTANTTLLTCQDSVFRDNSTNAYALTPTADVRPAFANPFGFTQTANIPFSPQINIGSAYFDGTGDYLTIPHNASLDLNSNNWTIECWVNPTGTAEMGVIGKRAGGSYGWLINIRNQRLLILGSSNGSSWTLNSGVVDGTTPITPGWWTHIAVVKNGTTVYGFVNGKLDVTYTSVVNMAANAAVLTIGANSATQESPYSGYISNLRVIKGEALYTQAFAIPTTPPAVNKNTVLQLDMDKSAIIDATASLGFETVGDAKITTESAYNGFNYSNYFDGTGDYLSAASNVGLAFPGDFTIECWVYPLAWATNAPICIGAAGSVQLGKYGTNANFGVAIQGLAWHITDAALPTLNTWSHVALTRSGTSLKIFINGVQSGSTGSTAYSFTTTNLIGGDGTLSYQGSISNFRVVKGTALYTANFTPSTTALTAVANTQLLTCQSNKFKDNSVNNLTFTRFGDVAVRSFNPFQRNTNTSMYFDGTGDWLTTPASSNAALGNGPFTIECWTYISGAQTQTYGHTLAGTYPGSGNGWVLHVNRSTGGPLGITWANGTPTGTVSVTYNTYLDTGRWYHIAVVRTSTAANGLKIYLDGVSVATGTDATNDAVLQTLYVAGGNTVFGGGYIEDFRITKGTARYTADFTPPAFKLPNK